MIYSGRLAGWPRFAPSLALAAVYLLFMALYGDSPEIFSHVLLSWDAMPHTRPFGDLEAILRAGVCWRRGVDVYAPSSCMLGGVYNYAPLLLRAADLGLGPADRLGGGVLLGALFIISLGLLPPPASYRDILVRTLAACSSSVVYALEAANFDLVVFLLVLAAFLLLIRGPASRFAGYLVLLFAAALKFYPAALLALGLRENFWRLAGLALVSAGLLLLYLAYFGGGTKAALGILPGGLPFRGVFGALNLPFGLLLLKNLPVLTLEPDVPQYFAALADPHAALFVALASRGLVIAALLLGYARSSVHAQVLAALGEGQKIFFLGGALLIAFCFLAAQNLSYRAIFLLMVLPGLAMMDGRAVRMLEAVILVLLWEGFFRHLALLLGIALLGPAHAVYLQILFWLLREALWWVLVIQLLGFVFAFLRQALYRLFRLQLA